MGLSCPSCDRPACEDCGAHHCTPWEALACDDFTDARRRRQASRRARQLGVLEAVELDESVTPPW